MRDLTDRAYLREEQYRDGRNLDARVRLHQLLSVTPGSLNRWLFERIPADPTSRVLELGCGPGHFWRETRDLRPLGWRVVCTDLSPGMVAEARRKLSGEGEAWALTVKQAGLPRAIVTYTFIPDEQYRIGEPMHVWRGPLAPPAPA